MCTTVLFLIMKIWQYKRSQTKLLNTMKWVTIYLWIERSLSYPSNGLQMFVQPYLVTSLQIGLLLRSWSVTRNSLSQRASSLRWTQRSLMFSRHLPSRVVSKVFNTIFLTLILNIVHNGVGVHMLKTGSKRRWTKMEIIQDKEEEIAKENEYRTKMARLE